MIPQPFAKGGGERVYFGPYEYPSGADLIFDFGNPTCTSAFNTSRIVYNVGTANVTGSLIPYNNPGPFYPTLSTAAGGVMILRTVGGGVGGNYLQWPWKSTEQQTNVFIFAMNGNQLNPWNTLLPQEAGASCIRTNVYGIDATSGSAAIDVRFYDSSNVGNDIFFTSYSDLNTTTANGRNGYNMISVSANATNAHNLYINQNLIATDSTSISRSTSGTQTTNFGINGNMRIMAFLQYPNILSAKQLRQIYKVFSQRFFT